MGEEIQWDPDAIAYIRSVDRYPGSLGIEAQWTQEVMDDVDLLALEPRRRRQTPARVGR